jgi:hypothetical protein
VIAATSRTTTAKALTALFLAASVLAGTAATADAAPMSKCRNNPENFSRFHGKCMSEKRIEKIQDRRGEGGADHGPNHQ